VQNNAGKLSIKEKVGYSLGDMASNLYFQIVMSFIPIFYTDVFGLPAAALSVMFLVTRLWDAVNDPMMGMIADRTNTKWGKYRPYLLLLALPFAIISVLTFTTPGFEDTGKLIYAYVTYTLMMMFYTAVNVPYSALMGVMTPSNEERTSLSSFRFVAAFMGALIVQSSILYLVKFFGNGDDVVGWQWAVGTLGGLAFILFAITFFTTKERVSPPKEQKSDFKQDLKDLFTNKPWLLIAGATIFQLTYIVLRSGSVTYYMRYFVQEQDFSLFGSVSHLSVEFLTSTFMVSGSVVSIIGAILTKWLTKKFDKRNTYAYSLAFSAFFAFGHFFLGPNDIILIYLFNLGMSFFFGTVSVLQWAMYTDTADYSEWKNGRRATGLIMAASLFALKLGLTLGGAIIGWILAFSGYEANVAQSAEAQNGILMLVSVYPAIVGLCGAALMIFYPLTNKKLAEIESDLSARREVAEAN
jgi:glycoside/pentoside/hexuronide:cation symporter, GPH family